MMIGMSKKEDVNTILVQQKLAKEETQFELNELDKLDTSKFDVFEAQKLEEKIEMLKLEVILRNGFISDLENLL